MIVMKLSSAFVVGAMIATPALATDVTVGGQGVH
jgi:hypothetical protein